MNDSNSETVLSGYVAFDVERWVVEPDKQSLRTPFERDRARVVHASALRRLASKTQVHTPFADDFVRTRLTHTLEVAQIGRELGRALGCDPDVVETACLAHDLGHPPFGHNGEAALDEFARDIGGFEGNAQTLRILTRLEAKSFCDDGRSAGLNLTRASLDAATKYPWFRGARGHERDLKFGVYADDDEVFRWLRAAASGSRRCIEAQVMDWSDDVAYSVHDLEDGIQSGGVDLSVLAAASERRFIAESGQRTYAPDLSAADLDDALATLQGQEWWPRSYDGSRRSLAGLKELTSRLVGRFSTAAHIATRDRFGPGRLTRYGADVVVPRQARAEVAMLKAVSARYLMHTDDRRPLMLQQRELLQELADTLLHRGPAGLPAVARDDWTAASDDAARRRVVVDVVASLTDSSAAALWQAQRS